NPDPAWSLGHDDEFVLEEDDTFGAGSLAEADLPPFDEAAPPPAANEHALAPLGDEDPLSMPAPTIAATLPSALRQDGRPTEQPVPRITIHAACDRPEIADIIAGIAADRRMARAEITVEPGGIDAAITRFSAQASPNLLIIDTQQQGASMLHSLDRL